MQRYRETARTRSLARQTQMQARRERAWAVARRAATLLKAEFGATRVVVFGSLTCPAFFHALSDVDLAVWGLKEPQPYQAWDCLLRWEPDIKFDLIEFEQAQSALRETIEHEGIEL